MNHQHELHCELQVAIANILRRPSYIHIDSIEPECERLPVPRGLLEAIATAFELDDKKITCLEQMTKDLARILREILQLDPSVRHHPYVDHAVEVLGKVEQVMT